MDLWRWGGVIVAAVEVIEEAALFELLLVAKVHPLVLVLKEAALVRSSAAAALLFGNRVRGRR